MPADSRRDAALQEQIIAAIAAYNPERNDKDKLSS